VNLHRRSRVAAAGLLVALVAAACGGGGDVQLAETTTTTSTSSTTTTTTTTTLPAGPLAPLTGLRLEFGSPVVDQPAIMVKISNNDEQSLRALTGLEQADVVIEERIEARATRFAAIFHSTLPSKLGAVRSGRPADIELMSNLNTPLFVFSGAFSTVMGDIRRFAANGGAVLVVDDAGGVNLVRDDINLNRPDNLFVDLPFLLEKFRENAGPATPIFEFLADGDEQSKGGVDGEAVTVTGRDAVSYVWDPDRGYVRVQDGVVHITSDDIALITDNLVVMETVYTPSSYDPRNVDAHTTGEGPVSVMVGGERFEGTWSRATAEDPYRFEDSNGAPILLEPGKTWLTLVPPRSYEFTVDEEIAVLVLNGEG
jgi:hypothetical protein